MRSVSQHDGVRRALSAVRGAGVLASVIVGAYLATGVGGSTGLAWAGWFALLPLFVVIRFWRPPAALLAGALWGGCLYAFGHGQPEAGMAALTFGSLLLFAAVPAAFTSAGAWLTRRIGFNPFVLGVAWMLAELALEAAGVRPGVRAGVEGTGTFLHWVGQAFGYVLVAFLIAVVSASLVSAVSMARLRVPRTWYRLAPTDHGVPLAPQTLICFPLIAVLRTSPPRAPPLS